jgi:hypothetical protein
MGCCPRISPQGVKTGRQCQPQRCAGRCNVLFNTAILITKCEAAAMRARFCK